MEHTDSDLPSWWPTDAYGNPYSLTDEEQEVYRKLYESDDPPEEVVAHLVDDYRDEVGDGDGDEDCPICGEPYTNKREVTTTRFGARRDGVSVRSDAEVCKGPEWTGSEQTMYVHLPEGEQGGESGAEPLFPNMGGFSVGSIETDSSHGGSGFVGSDYTGPDTLTISTPEGEEDEKEGEEFIGPETLLEQAEGKIERVFSAGDNVAVVYECGRVVGHDEVYSTPPGVPPSDRLSELEIRCACPDADCQERIAEVKYRDEWAGCE